MLNIYSVYDAAAEAYTQPFFAKAKGLAVRMFESAANEEGHNFQQHAADFTLFEIGQFNEQTGQMEGHRTHVNLGTALEYRKTPAVMAAPEIVAAEEGA